MRTLLLLISISAFGQEFVPNTTNPLVPKARHLLTNESVVSLAKAGFDEQFIVELIQSSRTRLDASTAALIDMKKQGLSEEMIRFIALRERIADQPPAHTTSWVPPPPMSTTHVEKHWWGYRWLTLSRPPDSARPTTSSTLMTGASNAPHAEITTSPR